MGEQENLAIAALIRLTHLPGAKYDECLRPETSVLVCYSAYPNSEKSQWAIDRGIPVVTANWMWSCMEHGKIQPFEAFSLASARAIRRHSTSARTPLTGGEGSLGNSSETAKSRPENAIKGAKLLRNRTLTLHRSHTDSQLAIAPNHPPAEKEWEKSSTLSSLQSSRALQDIAPEVNSLRLPSQTSSQGQDPLSVTDSRLDPDILLQSVTADQGELPAETDARAQSPSETQKSATIGSAISQLQAKIAASRPSTAPVAEPMAAPAANLRRRPLGRAANISVGGFSRTPSEDLPPAQEADNLDTFDRRREEASAYQFRPSQDLSYEHPDAKAARQKILARMSLAGDAFEGEEVQGMRVESVGLVKDARSASGDRGPRRRMTRNR